LELKNYSEECLKCKCRTCKSTYDRSDMYATCFTWCEEHCKGEDPIDFREDINKECHTPIIDDKNIMITVEEYKTLKEKASMYDDLCK